MKQIPVIIFVVFTFAFTTKLFSQPEKKDQLGIGISIKPSRIGHTSYYYSNQSGLIITTLANATPIVFYVPINVTERFRLEPSLAF